MRCVVAGAAGFIGSHLCERLLADGHQVVGLDNGVTGQARNLEPLRSHPEFTFVEQDICQGWPVTGAVDTVYNFACPASPIDFEPLSLEILAVCSDGVRQGLELAGRGGAVFVQASTSECYGDPLEHPQVETYWGHVNPIGKRSPYDEGKRYAEALITAFHRRHGLPVRIGRIFNTYGPRMRLGDGRVLPNFVQQALEGQPLTLYGDGRQTRSFCYVADLVDGFVRLAASAVVTPVNLGNPAEITIAELAREVIELTGSRSPLIDRPLPQDDPRRRRPDITKAQQLLNWQPTTERRRGLIQTIEDFRTQLSGEGPS